MKYLSRLSYTVLFAGASFVFCTCTDAGLQPKAAPIKKTYDNRLTIKGEYCVQPDVEVDFPVKVLLVIDQSDSLQFTDPLNVRFEAIQSIVGEILSNPTALIGTIGFASWSRYTDFTDNSGTILEAVGREAPGLAPATDYQGALATAFSAIESDIEATRERDPGEIARTRYVIVFVSDGVPEPRCLAGCEDDTDNCADGIDNDGDGLVDGSDDNCDNIGDNILHPDNLSSGICNFVGDPESDEYWQIREELDRNNEYVDFEMICPSYNTSELILQRVGDIIDLQDIHSVGDITLHSVFLFASEDEVLSAGGAIGAAFGYDQTQARNLLRAMAAAGNGAFRDVSIQTAADDSFMRFDYRAMQKPLWTSSFMARNLYATLTRKGYEPDTDADGIGDAAEQELGTNYKERDSDATPDIVDGYSDLFEYRYETRGFDPTDPQQPAIGCNAPDDLDNDGLLDCEENALETKVRGPDSDGDGILDWIEVVNGTDPTIADATEDLDFDGNNNWDEIRGGTDPLVPDADRYHDHRIEYEWADLGIKSITSYESGETAERSCATFEVRDIQLVTAPLVPDRGLNRILIYESERAAQLAGTQSETYVACFEAFYRSETSKDPESGEIDVTSESWTKLLKKIQKRVDKLKDCEWFDGDNFSRGQIESVIDQCLPDSVALGRFAYTHDDVLQLLRHYVANNCGINLTYPSSELFIEIENFDVNRHCHRPWELDYLFDLIDHILDACDSCSEVESGASVPDDYLDAGVMDRWQEAGIPNPCCYTFSR